MKKSRLYLHELLEDPAVSYPAWYLLSPRLHRNENLHETLRAIHSLDFAPYRHPENPEEIFAALRAGSFPIFRERYAAGYFGGKVMVLESGGWKSLPVNEESFGMQNWLI